jgi:hypothetical protein
MEVNLDTLPTGDLPAKTSCCPRKPQKLQRCIWSESTRAWGSKDKAFEWLEKSYAERSQGLIGNLIKVSPAYDPLRSDPRFADLLRRMNLQP